MTIGKQLQLALLSAIRQYRPSVRRKRQGKQENLFGACQSRFSNSSDKSCRLVAVGRRFRKSDSG